MNKNIQATTSLTITETGKSADNFKKLAAAKGYIQNGTLRADVKVGKIIAMAER